MKTIDAIFDLREAILKLGKAITEDMEETTEDGRAELAHIKDLPDTLAVMVNTYDDVYRELEGPVRHRECVQCGRRHDPKITCTEDRVNEAEYKEDR